MWLQRLKDRLWRGERIVLWFVVVSSLANYVIVLIWAITKSPLGGHFSNASTRNIKIIMCWWILYILQAVHVDAGNVLKVHMHYVFVFCMEKWFYFWVNSNECACVCTATFNNCNAQVAITISSYYL